MNTEEHAEEALTLSQAAQRLGVKPQRISQMLRNGDLTGPTPPDGRAPKNMGRVWISAIEGELRRRSTSPSSPTSEAKLAERVRAVEDHLAALEADQQRTTHAPVPVTDTRAEARERAALAAAATLKVSLEVTTRALVDERSTSAQLRAEVALLQERLNEAEQQAHTMNELAQTFGDSLTQLLAPDSPEAF